jgi:hypothetical protein
LTIIGTGANFPRKRFQSPAGSTERDRPDGPSPVRANGNPVVRHHDKEIEAQ